MKNSQESFDQEFHKWVNAYAKTGFVCDADSLLSELKQRIPNDSLRQIGAAIINGWLVTESVAGKGYYTRESDRSGATGGFTMLSHIGAGKVAPCWEYYVQLADYSKLRSVADARGLRVRLEDQLMDIAVWQGEALLLYVENKVMKSTATSLLKKMRQYGESGFGLEDPDIGNDGLRKAKYLFRMSSPPQYFALSAIGYQKLFSIEYLETNNRFRLTDIDGLITSPLLSANSDQLPPPRRLADALVSALVQILGDRIWVSPGSGRTMINVYLPAATGDSLMLGIYDSGELWTEVAALDPQIRRSLINHLASLQISFDPCKEWSFWSRNGARYVLMESEVDQIALGIASAVLGN